MGKRKHRKAVPQVATGDSVPLPHPGDVLPPGARVRLGTNRLNHVVRAGNTGVCRLEFSVDGRYLLALGYQDDEASLWELPSGREVWRRELGCGVDRGAGAAFSHDGRFVVIGNRALKVFDVVTGRDVRTLRSEWPSTDSLAFSPCGRYLAEGRYDARVDVWAVRGWKVVATLEGEPEPEREGTGDDHFSAVAFHPDGRLLAASSSHVIKRPCTKREFNHLLQEAKAGRGRHPAGGGPVNGDDWHLSEYAGRVWVWNWARGALVNRLEGATDGVNAVHFLPNGQLAASAQDETVRVWDVASGSELRCYRWGERGSNPFLAAFRPDGGAVAVPEASGSGDTRILDLGTGAEIRRFPHSYYLAFSPDGRTLVTAQDGRCELWDTETGTNKSPSGRHFERPDTVVFSEDGRCVLTAGLRARDAFVWDSATGELVATVPPRIIWNQRSLTLSPEGTRVAACHGQLRPESGGPKDPHLYVWDIRSDHVQEFPLDSDPGAITWTADGQAVVVSTRRGLLLHPLGGTRPAVTFRPNRANVQTLRTLPDGRVAGAAVDQLCIWEPSGKLVARAALPPPGNGLMPLVAVSSDGQAVAVLVEEEIAVFHTQPVGARDQSGRRPRSDRVALPPPFVIPEGFGHASFGGFGIATEFLADGRLLVAACRGNPEAEGPFVVKVWEAANKLEVWESPAFPGGISEVVFAPGGRSLAIALDDATTVVFDIPIRPTALQAPWLTPTVAALARGIGAKKAFDGLPVLADALQDAGCQDEDVLGHLRSGSAVRGCWVLNLILGKNDPTG